MKPLTSPPQGEGALPKCLKHSEMELSPLGEGWGGAPVGMIPGLLPPAMLLEDYLSMTNSRVPPAMMSA